MLLRELSGQRTAESAKLINYTDISSVLWCINSACCSRLSITQLWKHCSPNSLKKSSNMPILWRRYLTATSNSICSIKFYLMHQNLVEILSKKKKKARMGLYFHCFESPLFSCELRRADAGPLSISCLTEDSSCSVVLGLLCPISGFMFTSKCF